MSESLIKGDYAPGTNPTTRQHVERYERSNGQEGATFAGGSVIILTMRGARTGKLRKVALMRIERDGVYAVGATNGGAKDHPSWYHNLVANPEVELQDGPDRLLVTARVSTGDERANWAAHIAELYPFFSNFQAKAAELGGREIPLILLEPTRC